MNVLNRKSWMFPTCRHRCERMLPVLGLSDLAPGCLFCLDMMVTLRLGRQDSLFKVVVYISFFFSFRLFRAALVAYGTFQAGGRIGAAASCQPMPQPQQHRIRVVSVTYTAAQGNTGSLTHWAGPGIEPTSSWMVRFLSATMGTPR